MRFIIDLIVIARYAWAVWRDQRVGRDTGGSFTEPDTLATPGGSR